LGRPDEWRLLEWRLLEWRLLEWRLLEWRLLEWRLLEWRLLEWRHSASAADGLITEAYIPPPLPYRYDVRFRAHQDVASAAGRRDGEGHVRDAEVAGEVVLRDGSAHPRPLRARRGGGRPNSQRHQRRLVHQQIPGRRRRTAGSRRSENLVTFRYVTVTVASSDLAGGPAGLCRPVAVPLLVGMLPLRDRYLAALQEVAELREQEARLAADVGALNEELAHHSQALRKVCFVWRQRWRVEGGGWRVEGGGWRVYGLQALCKVPPSALGLASTV